MRGSRLLYVLYKDHVIFRNADPRLLETCTREVVGWLVKETKDSLILCFDRTVVSLPHELPCRESGLVVLKENILEKKELG